MSDELKNRTKRFAINVFTALDELPNVRKGWIIGDQLGRSGSSVGANYRAACRARSKNEFISKLGIVIEEADEAAFWLELSLEKELLSKDTAEPLLKEARELVAIMTASRKTAEENR